MRVLTLNPLLGPSLPLRGVGTRRSWTSSLASFLLHHQWKRLGRRGFLHRVYVCLQIQHPSFAKRWLRKKYRYQCEMSINDFMNTDIEIVMFGLEAQMFGLEAQVIGLSVEGLI
jgi:hypothetical protein